MTARGAATLTARGKLWGLGPDISVSHIVATTRRNRSFLGRAFEEHIFSGFL